VLTPAGWKRWTRSVAWRESEIDFDWPAIRERLREELATWDAAPSGAKHRRNQKIARLASELVAELASLSRADASDVALVERARPSLLALRDSLDRLLPSERISHTTVKETNVRQATIATSNAAEDIFDEGMEYWWAGDRRLAAKAFRRALELDPEHADAHNHLGIVDWGARRLKAAERHFRAAISGNRCRAAQRCCASGGQLPRLQRGGARSTRSWSNSRTCRRPANAQSW
jgi:tetratricopeptide (TPR) repeat protein